MDPDDEQIEHRSVPRSWSELRARIADAAHYGEHVSPPMVWGGDLVHRAVLLVIVAGITAAFLAVLATPSVALLGGTVRALAEKFDVEIGTTDLPKIAQRSVVVDRKGKILATLAGEENRIIVDLDGVPEVTRNAVLAIEDASFYDHHGVDLTGLARATLLNFRSGAVRQGGSTITQQLVKNTLVGTERSLERKIKEAKLAVELEKELGKDQILELYLNETYFGRGIYGIATAAEYYFGKDVSKLGLAESALLAGVIKAPESLEPVRNPDAAAPRRTLVLKRMLDEGMISSEQYERADGRKLGARPHRLAPSKTPFFVEFVKLRILDDERFGETRQERARALFQAGLRIETTLDLKLQRRAQRATEDILDRKDDPAAALVSIEPGTGAVRAMVGGRDFEQNKFNLAVQAARQPGSTFKPVTMLAALEAGLAPTLTFDTPSPIRLKDQEGKTYKVANYDGKSRGFIDMRTATELSVNTYFVQLIERVGPAKVVDMGERLGIETELEPFLSLALGSVGVSPLEMANAYATIAADGVRCEPFAITRVEDASGNTLIREQPECERTISSSVTAQGTDILQGVITRGTGRTNGQIGRPVAGKTGTTDEYTDAWFAGYTPQYATVVWLGYPDDTRRSLYNIHGLPQVFGGSLPAQIWNRYMRAAHDGLPILSFTDPLDVDTASVPDVVGMDFRRARKVLRDAGFTVKKRVVEGNPPEGGVLGTRPRAGKEVDPGILITVRVSDGSVPFPACSDGKDNDGDGETDHPEDDGCSGPDDNSEKDPPPPPKCSDGKDNDGDGKVDQDDPGCSGPDDNSEKDPPPPPPQCSDGEDNDGDGQIDHPEDDGCDDPNDNDETDPEP